MDTQKLIDITSEIVSIFARNELNRVESLYALETVIGKIHEQSLREIIREEIKVVKNPPIPGVG